MRKPTPTEKRLDSKPNKKSEENDGEEVKNNSGGYGKFAFQNQIIYEGQYKIINGERVRDGKGTLLHPINDKSLNSGESYVGEWKDDKMNGFGLYVYTNGDVYEGQFLNGLQNGHGKYSFTDGSRYEGDWKEHKMHGTGAYWDNNGVKWEGEFRDGSFLSKEQAKLKEEKRIEKKIKKYKEYPLVFYKSWEEVFVKVDKKNFKDLLSPFFASLENMSQHIKDPYPKLEERPPEKWNEAMKFIFNTPSIDINIPKTQADLKFVNKAAVLAPQLKEDLDSGQVLEVETILNERKIQLGLGYHKDMNKWLIIFFNEIISKPEKK